MQNYKLLLFTLVFVYSLFQSKLCAQSTKGTTFWCGYMENIDLFFNTPPEFSFLVETDAPTNVTIEVPATGLTLNFPVPANQITELFLPDATWYTLGSEIADNHTIRTTTLL